MAKSSLRNDLLTPDQAAEALGGNVTAYAVRKRVREGSLACHWQQATPGKIFVKRSELMKLYGPKIKKWKALRK